MRNLEHNQVDLNLTYLKAKEIITDFINECENSYRNQINEVVNDIISNRDIKVVLVAGPSSSGKTTSSNILMKKLQDKGIHSVVISLDNFFINRENTPKLPNGRYDFESPYSLDLEYLNTFIADLLDNGKALMPIYDFKSGERQKDYEEIVLTDNSVVLIEGIHAHNPLLFKSHTKNMYKLYVCLNSDFVCDNEIKIQAKQLRLMRRSLRDYLTRGHSVSATLTMWDDVLDGEEKYIKPYKPYASYIIDTTHPYEPMLYKKYLSEMLETVSNPEAKDLLEILKNFDCLDKSNVPDGSLLWEFLGE